MDAVHIPQPPTPADFHLPINSVFLRSVKQRLMIASSMAYQIAPTFRKFQNSLMHFSMYCIGALHFIALPCLNVIHTSETTGNVSQTRNRQIDSFKPKALQESFHDLGFFYERNPPWWNFLSDRIINEMVTVLVAADRIFKRSLTRFVQ